MAAKASAAGEKNIKTSMAACKAAAQQTSAAAIWRWAAAN